MPTVWQLLETIPGPAAVPAVWKASLGADFDTFREAFLRQLPTPAKSYPCPRECGCAHEIVRHKSGPIVAVCRCEPSHCDDIRLTDADVAILELNWPKLGRAIAQAFGLTRREAEVAVPHAIQIAAYGDDALPVILTIQHDRDAFRQAVTALAAHLRGRFILFAPTADFMDAVSQQVLSGLGAVLLPLDTTVQLTPPGDLSAVKPPEELLARALATPTAAANRPPATPPPTIEEAAVLDLCRANPNQAFLYWQSFEADLAHCPPLGRENERKFRAMRDTFREWFEDLGHWRDLRPKSKDLDPDDHNAHAKHQKQIEDFIATRRAKMHPPIEYDEVRKAHRVQYEGTEHEDVEYNWEFFRDGISQVIVRTAGGNVLPPHRDPLKRQYFKNTPPSGYAILESGEKLEGTVFFPNGDSYGFDPCFGDENRFYPEELFRAGDYELRKVQKKTAPHIDDLAKHTALIIEKVEAQPLKTAALLRGTIKQRLGTLGTVVEEDFTASPHFTNLTWRGNQYVLRQTAAVIIETLYIAQKYYGIPGFHQEEVFAQVYGSNKKDWPSGKTRIQNFFRTGDAKRLWDDGLIDHDSKGNFRLNLKIHTHTQ